jgi:hypothetical protein
MHYTGVDGQTTTRRGQIARLCAPAGQTANA